MIGLCGRCRHHAWVVSGRGSRFLFCERSRREPEYPKYPPLPIADCPGYEPFPAVEEEDGEEERSEP